MDARQVELAVTAFVTFFVLIDAVGVAPIFASLTQPGGPKFARSMAIRSSVVAAGVLFFFAFAGAWLLEHLGVSLDAFRAAGGVLMFLIAVDMVFEKRTERREHRAEALLADGRPETPDDISVFPIGIPMIAGPGSIATAMLYMQNAAGEPVDTAIVIGAIGLNLLLTAVIFLAAGPLMRLIGPSLAGAITRILGVILAALAVQLMIDGVKGAFGL
ncbi:NAAT family transporter [bacterium]|nr:NAAT family transporter [bacterium]